MDRKIILFLILMISYFSHSSLITESRSESEKSLNMNIDSKMTYENSTFIVVTTQSFLADFTQHIVGNLFQVTSIVKGTEDPHSFTPKPSDVATINKAQVFITYGVSDIDGWADSIISALSSTTKVIKVVNLEQDGIFDPFIGIGELNPHLWMSPKFVNSTILERIYSALVDVDPIHAQLYKKNMDLYRVDLNNLIQRVNGNITVFQNLEVVEYHAAFFYLLRDLNITRLGTIERIENQEPPALHVANITKIMKEEIANGKDVVLVQSLNLANEISNQVAHDTGAKISHLVALMGNYPSRNFTTYIDMIDYDLIALSNPVSASTSSLSAFEYFNSFIIIFAYVIVRNNAKVKKD